MAFKHTPNAWGGGANVLKMRLVLLHVHIRINILSSSNVSDKGGCTCAFNKF
jgi:hypothetical protein